MTTALGWTQHSMVLWMMHKAQMMMSTWESIWTTTSGPLVQYYWAASSAAT